MNMQFLQDFLQTYLPAILYAALTAVAPRKDVVRFSVRIRRVMNGDY